jgi:hypothetical protein
MSLLVVIEHCDRLEVRSPMGPGFRIVLMLLGVLPLLAPYELLVRIEWQDHLSPFFLLAALISAGAVVLSLFLVFAALAGLRSRLVFDRNASTLTYSYEAPVVKRTSRVYPLSAVGTVEVEQRTWTDGAPTYHLRVVMNDGAVIESGSSLSRDEVEAIRTRIERFTTG